MTHAPSSQRAEYIRAYKADHFHAGLCADCNEPRAIGKLRCAKHLAQRRATANRRRAVIQQRRREARAKVRGGA